MAKGSRSDQQFKENAVRYRLDHPELSLRRHLRIWESAIPPSRHGSEQPESTKGTYQHAGPEIIPAMRQKKSPVSSVNSGIQRMHLKF